MTDGFSLSERGAAIARPLLAASCSRRISSGTAGGGVGPMAQGADWRAKGRRVGPYVGADVWTEVGPDVRPTEIKFVHKPDMLRAMTPFLCAKANARMPGRGAWSATEGVPTHDEV